MNTIPAAATTVLEARERLQVCPPQSPHWRDLVVTAEEAWQGLVFATGSAAGAQQVLTSGPYMCRSCDNHLVPAGRSQCNACRSHGWVQ
jgi:hypothetical protein